MGTGSDVFRLSYVVTVPFYTVNPKQTPTEQGTSSERHFVRLSRCLFQSVHPTGFQRGRLWSNQVSVEG